MNSIDNTTFSYSSSISILTWCLFIPFIHMLSLFSNIICICVFCSKTFVKKPISIYFVCLLLSDSTTLLIGYGEMLERQPYMVDGSSCLCLFNRKIVQNITEFIYAIMGRFCLEWALYKVLWIRASTILLAILSIQRSRTFFSLQYHETRFFAICACIISFLIALIITCLEWIGFQCEKSTNPSVYFEIYQLMMTKTYSREFYSKFLNENYNESMKEYSCMLRAFNNSYQSNCPNTNISNEFYSFTQSLLSHNELNVVENTTNLLTNLYDSNFNATRVPSFIEYVKEARSSDLIIKSFEKRSCQITLSFHMCIKTFYFLHSLLFSFNRHTLAIIFGNAIPSFIVFLANLFSLKVIYFSKSLKYLQQTRIKHNREDRLNNDIKGFIVILIESFSTITISWGIPIFLTLYYCQTLYVVSVSSCPQIKPALAFFLFADLFNSSKNCVLYSLSGKLFRRKYLEINKMILTCGRHVFFNSKKPSISLTKRIDHKRLSNDTSINIHSKTETRRNSEIHSSFTMKRLKRLSNHENVCRNNHVENIVTKHEQQKPKIPIGFIDSLISFGKKSNQQPVELNHVLESKGPTLPKLPLLSHQFDRVQHQTDDQQCSSEDIFFDADDNNSMAEKNVLELVTAL